MKQHRRTARISLHVMPILIVGLLVLVLFQPDDRPAHADLVMPQGMALVPEGTFEPLFASEETSQVRAFLLDVHPITNAEFLGFVMENPGWQRSNVHRAMADSNYLKHWDSDTSFGADSLADRPVVNVSWFAAEAYAAWSGKRLPTVAEWERAASAGFDRPDGANDPNLGAMIAAWYSSPLTGTLPRVGEGAPNYYGVHDLHSLVWEWVLDFNTSMGSGDGRAGSDLDNSLFCGSGGAGARNPTDYATFLRYGFRNGLDAAYTTGSLGFRLAADLPANQS